MQIRRMGGTWVAVATLPVAFLLCQWAPSGMPEAEGCSGSSSVAQPVGIARAFLPPSAAREVATDGFLVLWVDARGVSAEDVLDGVDVSASVAGEPVTGTLKLLGDQDAAGLRPDLGWSADSELAVGSVLSVSVTAGGKTETFDLTVAGAPTSLTPPRPTLGSWYQIAHGVGETITCVGQSSAGACDRNKQPVFSLPAGEELRDATDVSWESPSITGFVAWRAQVDIVEDPEEAELPSDRTVYHADVVENVGPSTMFSLGRLMFPPDASDHCVTLTVEDLRTGQQVTGEPVCLTRAAKPNVVVDTQLELCLEPPNEALTARWCELHPASTLPACAPLNGGGGGGPVPGGVAGSGGTSAVGNAGSRANDAAPQGESSACSVSVAGAAGGSLLPAVALALLIGNRRRARSH